MAQYRIRTVRSLPVNEVYFSRIDQASDFDPDLARLALLPTAVGVNYVGTRFDNSFTGTVDDDTAQGLGGNDTLIGLGGDDLLEGGTGGDHLEGGDGDDLLVGGDSDDRMEGGAGDDLLDGDNPLEGSIDRDHLEGGDGDDTYYVDVDDVVIELEDGGNDRVYTPLDFLIHYTLAAGREVELLSPRDVAYTGPVFLTGNEFAQTLIGNAGYSELDGGGGADILIGLGGDDLYYVHDAADQVIEAAGEGYDTVWATVSYALPHDASIEALGVYFYDSTGAINLTGNRYDQFIHGNFGNNVLIGGGGSDIMSGLDGNDIYYVDDSAATVFERADEGFDIVYTSVSFNLDVAHVELLSASSHGATNAITLIGSSSANTLMGNAGANVLDGGGGADALRGLGGNDAYYVDTIADAVIEVAGGGNDQVYSSANYTLGSAADVELLSTISHAATTAINLTGNGFAQSLIGNAGANALNGGGGADVMHGLGGDDQYLLDSADDLVFEAAGGGSDTVRTSVSFALGASTHVELLRTVSDASTASINLTGNGFVNALTGNVGANVLDGGGGADFMSGLAGDDTYHVDHAGDAVTEGAGGGSDLVLASVSYALTAGARVERLAAADEAGTAALSLTGNSFDNEISGNAGANVINGRGGADVLAGLGGNDTYFTDVAAAQIIEAAGGGVDALYTGTSYALAAGAEVETLSTSSHGGTTGINLIGNATGQTIVGNAGQNMIDGKGGKDFLIGLGGIDVFAFTTALGAGNVDRLQDFQGGLDKIGLDDAIFPGLPGGTLLASAFVTGPAAQDPNHRIVYNNATGEIFFDSDGSGPQAQILFAVVTAGINLVSGDFIVI